MSNIETVQSIYEAFGQGNIPAILEKLDQNVDWEYGASPSNIPWLQPIQGSQNVVKFFESLGELEFLNFTVKEVLGINNLVIGVLDLEAIVKHNGQKISEVDEIHLWRFNDAGKVAAFRHRADTKLQSEAYSA